MFGVCGSTGRWYSAGMEASEYVAKAKAHFKGTVGRDQTPPTPDDLPRVKVRETVLVDFQSENGEKHVFVLLDRTTGDFVAGGSSAR